MPVRTPLANELFAASLQTAQGTPATPATGDLLPFVSCDLNPRMENLERADKGLGRSKFGFVAGGKQSATWQVVCYLNLASAATPPAAPLGENLIVAALGSPAVVFSDTVQSTPTPTASTFAVSNASSLRVGDVLAVNIGGSVGWQMRPISAISNNTLTFSPWVFCGSGSQRCSYGTYLPPEQCNAVSVGVQLAARFKLQRYRIQPQGY